MMGMFDDIYDQMKREKLSREMTHQQSYGQTDPRAQAMVDYARVTQDPNYVEPGLEGGVPTENVTGLGLSPLDFIGAGMGIKAATLFNKPIRTTLESKGAANALQEARLANTYKFNRGDISKGYGRRIGFPQEKGTDPSQFFSNFAGDPLFKTGHTPEMIEAAKQRFTKDMLERASRAPTPYSSIQTYSEPFMDKYNIKVDVNKLGNARVAVYDGDNIISSAAIEKGMLDSIATKEDYQRKGIGKNLLKFLDEKGIANIHEVPDRSPEFVKIQKAVLTKPENKPSFPLTDTTYEPPLFQDTTK